MKDAIVHLVNTLGADRVKRDHPLKLYTNWKVGGPADYLFEATSADELYRAVVAARESNLPYFILGLGANTLASDAGYRGLVIINRANRIQFLPHALVEAESGVNLALFMKAAQERNLYGTERMYKAPGTIGGALFMNAGETKRQEYYGDLAVKVKIVTADNKTADLTKADCEFSYRTSRFQKTNEVILSAILQLKEAAPNAIENRIEEIKKIKENQPPGPSGGSTFRNPAGYSIATILDKELGLKGYQIGGAKFSDTHANFILNTGTASSADIKALIDLAKTKVKAKYGFEPEEEIRYLGSFD